MKIFKRGFTLIELMVVVSIIALLSAVLYANFNDSRAQARDRARMSDLKEVQLALEFYKAQNGRYPAQGCSAPWAGPGPATDPSTCEASDYIVGLVPDYIAKLPTDPVSEMLPSRGFYYMTNPTGSAYKLQIYHTVERMFITSYGDEFARCPRSYASLWCPVTAPTDIYAVYSAGAEDW